MSISTRIIRQVKARLAPLDRRLRAAGRALHVAVMGCEVNGPGEARDADVGIASGRHQGLLFRHGEILGSVPEAEIVDALLRNVEELTGEMREKNKSFSFSFSFAVATSKYGINSYRWVTVPRFSVLGKYAGTGNTSRNRSHSITLGKDCHRYQSLPPKA